MRLAVSVMLATAVVLSTAAGAAEQRSPVQALLFKGRTVSFTTLDPTTLEQRGRLVPLGRAQGSVSSDRGAERTLQKAISGPRRNGTWLGDGTLAVSGSDERVTGNDPRTLASTPFWLRYVTSGGVRIVDARATDVRAAGELALAYGLRYSEGSYVGLGLAAYDRQGTLRWQALGDTPVSEVKLANGLGYAWAGGRWHVVELATGAVVGGSPRRAGMLLLSSP